MLSPRKLTFPVAVGTVLFAAAVAIYTYAALRHSDPDRAIASRPEAGDLPEIAPAAGGDENGDDDSRH